MERPFVPGTPAVARGSIPGLWPSLIRMLKAGRDFPVDCWVGPGVQLTVVIPDLLEYGWVEQADTASIAAGSSTLVDFFTVPTDQRWRLSAMSFYRASGDNTFSFFQVTQPEGYGSGTRVARLTVTGIGSSNFVWPSSNDVNKIFPLAPLLLEPGAILSFQPNGAGVSATVWTFGLLATATKVVRSRAP